MRLPVADLVEWLGPEARRLWATSFTVDELIAFAVAYRSIGSRLGDPSGNRSPVQLRFPRAGFRRAGAGSIPRSWLKPVRVPVESPLPSYHPKIFLSETQDGFRVAVSTGNLAQDDVARSSNLVVRFDASLGVAEAIRGWIESCPRSHRALCVHERGGELAVMPAAKNRATYGQFRSRMARCRSCRKAPASGEWILAAPFWSPGAMKRLLKDYPGARVRAFFRSRGLWDAVGWTATQGKDAVSTENVKAYCLGDSRGPSPWHQKVYAWRCCDSKGARTVLYVGSANATVSGFFGRGDAAVNWEAGALWTGSSSLWETAESAARGGLSPIALKAHATSLSHEYEDGDEIGDPPTSELSRLLGAAAANFIRVNRGRRTVARARKVGTTRFLGGKWSLESLHLQLDEKAQLKDVGELRAGKERFVPDGARPIVRAIFECQSAPYLGLPERAQGIVHIGELDPEPLRTRPTQATSISAARAALKTNWLATGEGGGSTRGRGTGQLVWDDVRFPFAEFFDRRDAHANAAAAWLDRVLEEKDSALGSLPRHWRWIAASLRGRR